MQEINASRELCTKYLVSRTFKSLMDSRETKIEIHGQNNIRASCSRTEEKGSARGKPSTLPCFSLWGICWSVFNSGLEDRRERKCWPRGERCWKTLGLNQLNWMTVHWKQTRPYKVWTLTSTLQNSWIVNGDLFLLNLHIKNNNKSHLWWK